MRFGGTPSRRQGFILLYGCGITLLACFLFIYRPHLFSLAGHKVYDSMVRSLPQYGERPDPVVIDLDERSLAEFGQWPWPRYRVAQLLDPGYPLCRARQDIAARPATGTAP